MNSIISQMLEKYDLRSKESCLNALKEIVQEITLSALAKSDFFDYAAFYGGTALRIFYGLDRYSEDLDFSLMQKQEFDLSKYFKIIDDTFKMYNMNFVAEKKEKSIESTIQSAFLKGNTLEHFLIINTNSEISKHIQKNEVIKIKFEIDVEPPSGATYDFKYGYMPIPYRVRLYDKSSLFAGKLAAVISRGWKNRVKGRDLYDFIYYVSTNTTINMDHLKARLVQSNKIQKDEILTIDRLKELLTLRFKDIDFENAKCDVLPFINDKSKLNLWSFDFFEGLLGLLK